MSLAQTQDGSFVLAGWTLSNGAGIDDFWLVKTDSLGRLEWSTTYGGLDYDEATSVVQTQDGGYVLAGMTKSYGSGREDFWLVKTDPQGNEEWSRTFGGGNWDFANSVIQTPDGGYALAGETESYGAGGMDFWLVKLTKVGKEGEGGEGLPLVWIGMGIGIVVAIIAGLVAWRRL